jgi:hypothetical protein
MLSDDQRTIEQFRRATLIFAPLMAFSALAASIQPLVDKVSSAGGIVFSIIGIVSALLSVTLYVVDSWRRKKQMELATVAETSSEKGKKVEAPLRELPAN